MNLDAIGVTGLLVLDWAGDAWTRSAWFSALGLILGGVQFLVAKI